MADAEEADRRRWLLAVTKMEKPVEAYEEWTAALEEHFDLDTTDIENHPMRDWLRAT